MLRGNHSDDSSLYLQGPDDELLLPAVLLGDPFTVVFDKTRVHILS